MTQDVSIALPSEPGTIQAVNVKTGQVTKIDVNNPSPEAICQMIEVLRRRIHSDAPNSTSVLKLIYLDQTAHVPPKIRSIVQDLYDDVISRQEADTALIAYAATLKSSG